MTDRRLPLVGINLLYVRPGYVGGTVRYAEALIPELARLGRFRLKLYVQADAFRNTDEAWRDLPTESFRLPGGVGMRVLFEQACLPLFAWRDNVDLLFSPGFVSPLLGRFHKVVAIHDLYYVRFPHFVRPWQRRYWKAFIPWSLRAVDAAITISDSTRADLLRAFPWAEGRTRRIHLGGDALPGPASDTVTPGGTYALVVGNVTPNKNIETVVSAFARLGRACRLVVAGSDPSGTLARSVESAVPRPDVVLMEHVDDQTLAALYARAACLIQASHCEGFGLPVVEAMTAGCPVVASDIAVMRELGGDAAVYFPTTSAEGLAAAVRGLLDDQPERHRRIEAGRARAHAFRWKTTAEQTARLFEQVLGGRA
jgi:glycosyltransferase involved in cell wall biosynthesis